MKAISFFITSTIEVQCPTFLLGGPRNRSDDPDRIGILQSMDFGRAGAERIRNSILIGYITGTPSALSVCRDICVTQKRDQTHVLGPNQNDSQASASEIKCAHRFFRIRFAHP